MLAVQIKLNFESADKQQILRRYANPKINRFEKREKKKTQQNSRRKYAEEKFTLIEKSTFHGGWSRPSGEKVGKVCRRRRDDDGCVRFSLREDCVERAELRADSAGRCK